MDFPAARGHLCSRAASRTCRRADRRPFSAARDCADNAADYRASADEFTGPAVLADSQASLRIIRSTRRIHYVTAAVDGDRLQIQRHIVWAGLPYDEFGWGSTRNPQISVGSEDVAVHRGRVDPTAVPFI